MVRALETDEAIDERDVDDKSIILILLLVLLFDELDLGIPSGMFILLLLLSNFQCFFLFL
jgi:hypothetical protein